MDIIVSLPYPVRNWLLLEASFNGGAVCLGCHTFAWDRLAPVVLTEGGEIDHEASPSCTPLCRVCSFRSAVRNILAEWPKVTKDELADIWRQAREAQALDAAKMYETRAISAGQDRVA